VEEGEIGDLPEGGKREDSFPRELGVAMVEVTAWERRGL